MLNVVLVEVRRRDVAAAAEPPHAAVGLEVPVVEVHRRRHRVPRVHDLVRVRVRARVRVRVWVRVRVTVRVWVRVRVRVRVSSGAGPS